MNTKLEEQLALTTFSNSIIFEKLYFARKYAQFMRACHYFCLQNIKISFEHADFYAKISLILDTKARNSLT